MSAGQRQPESPSAKQNRRLGASLDSEEEDHEKKPEVHQQHVPKHDLPSKTVRGERSDSEAHHVVDKSLQGPQ